MEDVTNAVDVAVIVVSYNTRDLLHDCLASLTRQRTPRIDVWVVDNASGDGTVDMVRNDYPSVHLLALQENVGFAEGNNVALREMGFSASVGAPPSGLPPYVLFLNPDTRVLDGALDTMRAFLASHPAVGVAGCRLEYPDGTFQHSAFRFPTLWQIWFDFFAWPGRFIESELNGRFPRSLYDGGVPFLIDHPLGAAMMTRREVIEDVGLMDGGFFMYAEEVDWNLRARAAGWEVYCVPAATIVHVGGASTSRRRTQMNEALWQSRFKLFRKHYPRVFQVAARLLYEAGRLAESGCRPGPG